MRSHQTDPATLPAVISGIGLLAILLTLLATLYFTSPEPPEDGPTLSGVAMHP
jgi:hypothetical protein